MWGRSRPIRRLTPFWILLCLLLAAPVASAHGDVALAGGEAFTLAPGESKELEGRIHYHRLVGRVTLLGGAPVTLALVRADAREEAPLWRSGPVEETLRMNEPLECCDGVTYTPVLLVVTNPDPARAARVEVQAKLVHDDLLVGFAGKEGAAWQTLAPFWVPSGFFAWHAGRAHLRPARPAGPALGHLRRSLWVSVATVAVFVVLALVGRARFGGGPVAGLAGAAGYALPSFGTGATILLALVAWSFALAYWLRAWRAHLAGDAEGRAWTVALGLAQAGVLLLAPPALVSEYGMRVAAVAWLAAAPAALVQVAASARLGVRSGAA